MANRPAVSATIVTYNSYGKARDAVASLLRHTESAELTLYVVDNASSDNGLQKLKDEFPAIVAIQNADNLGFGHGHNTVLPLLESELHFVVNPDITIDSDVLGAIAGYMGKNRDIGLMTPQILNADGTDQALPKRDPTVGALIGRRIPFLFKKQVDHYVMKDVDLTAPVDIEFATGSFFCIETAIFKQIGGFDERFFMYYEDMDITRRARAVKRAVYYPYVHVTHLWERSSAKSLKYFMILIGGMFKYFGKWGWKFTYKQPRKKGGTP